MKKHWVNKDNEMLFQATKIYKVHIRRKILNFLHVIIETFLEQVFSDEKKFYV